MWQANCVVANVYVVLTRVDFWMMPMLHVTRVVSQQGSRSPKFGAEIRPHSQSQKVCFFPNSR